MGTISLHRGDITTDALAEAIGQRGELEPARRAVASTARSTTLRVRCCSRSAARSAGAFGYPLEQAAQVAVSAVRESLRANPGVREARFWLFDAAALRAFEAALTEA